MIGKQRKKNEVKHNGDVTTLYTSDRKEIVIDTEDYPMVSKHCWNIMRSGYVTSTISGKPIYLHRFILNPSSDMEVDHINCNKADNRKENLRICHHYQNSKNRKKKSNNTSGIVGVTYDKRRNKWVARIWDNGKKIHLGEFKDIEDAIKTRKEAEIKYYGEYAYKGE